MPTKSNASFEPIETNVPSAIRCTGARSRSGSWCTSAIAHRHERMAVETLPGSPFEVIEAKFLFQLLMGLLANPSCLDGGRQGTQTGRCRQIGEMVFLFA